LWRPLRVPASSLLVRNRTAALPNDQRCRRCHEDRRKRKCRGDPSVKTVDPAAQAPTTLGASGYRPGAPTGTITLSSAPETNVGASATRRSSELGTVSRRSSSFSFVIGAGASLDVSRPDVFSLAGQSARAEVGMVSARAASATVTALKSRLLRLRVECAERVIVILLLSTTASCGRTTRGSREAPQLVVPPR
jgi:hypothetical protein